MQDDHIAAIEAEIAALKAQGSRAFLDWTALDAAVAAAKDLLSVDVPEGRLVVGDTAVATVVSHADPADYQVTNQPATS